MCSDDTSVVCPVNGVLASVSFAFTGDFSYRGDYNGNLIIATGQIINNVYFETDSINISAIFIPSMFQLKQNLPENSTDATMDALLNLVSTIQKEIKRLNILIVPNRAHESIGTHNTHIDKKTKQRVANKVQQYDMLQPKDYDGDGLADTIVTKDGKIYSFNGFVTKDNDYPLRQVYLNQGFKHENKKGESVYIGYSMKNLREHYYNPVEPRKEYYSLNSNFWGHFKDVAQHYPSVRKYQ
jgi:hypothetical protein